MSEHQNEAVTQDATEGVRPAVRPVRRKRMLALAGLASATLAFGGLTACDTDSPTKGSDSSDTDADAADDDSDDSDGESDDAQSLAAGETAVWGSGLRFTLGEPEEFTASEGYIEDGNVAYKFTVTVENEGDEEVNGDPVLRGRAGEDGVSAEQIFDSANDIGMDMASTLRPGDKATGTIGFEVPADAESMALEVSPFDFESDSAWYDIDLG